MRPKHLFLGGALALTLAVLLTTPAWLGAAEPATEEAAPEPRPMRGFLGVGLQELSPELQAHFGALEGSGVLVASVAGDGPAAAAGILVGDVITAVDGLAVDSARDVSREIRHRPGEAVAIELYRDGEPLRLTANLGARQARGWGHHAGGSPAEWAEHWQRWGEDFGESMGRWGEEFGESMGRWGEQFGQRWGEEHSAEWQRWAEEMGERGEGWEEMGAEIGRTVEKALSDVDWEQIGRSVEESMKALEGIDWEGLSEQIERHMEELEQDREDRRGTEAPSE